MVAQFAKRNFSQLRMIESFCIEAKTLVLFATDSLTKLILGAKHSTTLVH